MLLVSVTPDFPPVEFSLTDFPLDFSLTDAAPTSSEVVLTFVTFLRGNGIPREREVDKRREVCEWER